MNTKKYYIAPMIKALSYRTEAGFDISIQRANELLRLDFLDHDNSGMETWGGESQLDPDNSATWVWE